MFRGIIVKLHLLKFITECFRKLVPEKFIWIIIQKVLKHKDMGVIANTACCGGESQQKNISDVDMDLKEMKT